MLNIAAAYFVVNYSDVNCIVNKSATFSFLSNYLYKMCWCREQAAKAGSWVEAPGFGFSSEGPIGGRLVWTQSETGRLVPSPEH